MLATAVLVFLFGVALLGAGQLLLWAVLDPRFAPYLDAWRMLRNWMRMVVQRPAESGADQAAEISAQNGKAATSGLVFADSFSFRVKAKHQLGYYFVDRGPTIGSAARVHVPLDCVARLSYIDRWQDRRLLDTSNFVLRTDDANNELEFIARGRRCCFDFNDDSILAKDGYIMNCQLAVHWYVPLALDRKDEFDYLFNNLHHLTVTLRDGASGVLRKELTTREYRSAMQEADQILAELNEHWRSSPHYEPYRKLVHVEFTALMIRPREEAERRFLDRLGRGRAKLREQIDEIAKEIKGKVVHITDHWKDISQKRELAVSELTDQLPHALVAQSTAVSTIIVQQGTTEDAINQARGAFEAGMKQLGECSDRLMNAYDQLGDFIHELDDKTKEFLQKPDGDDVGVLVPSEE